MILFKLLIVKLCYSKDIQVWNQQEVIVDIHFGGDLFQLKLDSAF